MDRRISRQLRWLPKLVLAHRVVLALEGWVILVRLAHGFVILKVLSVGVFCVLSRYNSTSSTIPNRFLVLRHLLG